MKKLTQLLTYIVLFCASLPGWAQTVGICAGSSTVYNAINSQNLTNTSYSINPVGLTSSNGTFTLTAPAASQWYTVSVTGLNSNSSIVTNTYALQVIVIGVSYQLASVQNYTLGCNSKSVCVVNIINPQGYGGGAAGYTILPPGSPTIIGTPTTQTSYSITIPGIWTIAVVDLNYGCVGLTPVNIISNTLPPSVSVLQSPATCTSPAVLSGTSSALATYVWQPMNFANSSVSITANTAMPTLSVTGAATLQVTDTWNHCVSTTVVSVFQNLYPPVAQIMGGSQIPGACQPTVYLVNVSSTGIPNSLVFSTSQPITGLLWQGPPPQNTLSMSSTYTAFVSGVYTLTVQDQNNGCISSTTKTVAVSPSAAFTHTVTNGQVAFNDASTNINGNNTVTYFWDFGDGTYTSQQNPSHTYNNAGAYIVKFKVIQQGFNCSDSVMQAVTVSGIPCSANSSFTLAPTGTAQVWNASPLYPWNISNATWDWGDGSYSNVLYTSHTYSAAGLYNICLTVTVNCVASSSSCSTYSVYKVTQEAMILKINVVEPALIETGIKTKTNDNALSWNIIPNPNEGEFKLDLNTSANKNTRVIITDLSGRLVHEQSIEAHSNSVNVNTGNLPSGVYLVSLESEGLKLTKRMIVNH